MGVYLKARMKAIIKWVRFLNEKHGSSISIMEKEEKWNSPQQFIQDTHNEKLDRWHKEHAVG